MSLKATAQTCATELTRPAIALRFFLLTFFLALLLHTLLSEWRGGIFIQFVLAGTATVQFLDLAKTVRDKTTERVAFLDSGAVSANEPGWRDIGAFFALAMLLAVLVAIFGFYVGLTLYSIVMLRVVGRVSWFFTITYGMIAGGLVPVLSTWLFDFPLWPGWLPAIMPRWFGGGILPPDLNGSRYRSEQRRLIQMKLRNVIGTCGRRHISRITRHEREWRVKMPSFKVLKTCTLVALCGLMLATTAVAQDSFFTKAITVIVPYSAGSNLTAARVVAPALQKRLGVPVGVLSVPGPNGWNQVYRANPDGYTIGVGDIVGEYAGNLANPMPYNTKEFEVLGTLTSSVSVLAVGAHTKIKTFDELVAAGQGGKKLRYASFGVSASLIQSVLLSERKKFGMTRVVLGSPRDAALATVRGDADFGILGTRLYLDQIQAKQVVPLLVWGKELESLTPGVPNLIDVGADDLDPVTSHRAIFLPPKVPPAVTKAWIDALSDVLSSAELTDQFKSVFLERNHKLGPEFKSLLDTAYALADKNKEIIIQMAR